MFKKLGFEVSDDVIHNITTCKPWAAEQFLLMLHEKLEMFVPPPPAQSLPLSSPSSGINERFEHGPFSTHFSGKTCFKLSVLCIDNHFSSDLVFN